MAYEQTDALKRKIDTLSTPVFSGRGAGLANAIRMRRAGKYEKQLTAAEERNQANQANELAMLLKGAETGRVGPTLVSAQMQDFNPTDPTVRELAAKLRLDKATKGKDLMTVGAGQTVFDPETKSPVYSNPAAGKEPSFGASVVWGKDAAGKYVPFQVSTGGGLTKAEVPEGIDMLPSAGLLGYDPEAVANKGEVTNQLDLDKLQKSLQLEIEAAVQKASQLAAAPKQRGANEVLAILDMAEPLLETATGSGLGALRDKGAALIGMGGKGAESAARLAALSGLLVSKMPRMEGPQSNYDVQLYTEMAGKIGDPTTPNNVRKAAMDTIRQINEKYAAGQSQLPYEQPAGVSDGGAASSPQPARNIIQEADEILKRSGI